MLAPWQVAKKINVDSASVCAYSRRILLTLCVLTLGNIIRKQSINFHRFADDTQLYLSLMQDKSSRLSELEACLKDIKIWITSNFLLLNVGRPEVIVLDSNI